MADISIRESIRWKPDAPSEPTSTLVLTSPDKHFVDVRILLPLNPEGDLTKEQLDWAFAGRSRSTPRETEVNCQLTRCTHSVWKHWVDSRTLDAETVVDEGDMFDIPGGRTLETGKMVNPATGRETEYEEVWRSAEPLGSMKGVVVVLRTEDEDPGRRGVVVRVGQYVQGILRDGDDVMVQRMEWKAGAGWGVTAKLGPELLDFAMGVATGEDTQSQNMKLGGTVTGSGIVWQVVELSGDVEVVMP